MKNILNVVIAVATLSTNAFAIYATAFERPKWVAEDMEIVEAHVGYDQVERVDMTLTQRDGEKQATGITVEMVYPHSAKPVVTNLVVDKVSTDRCGTVTYQASLHGKTGDAGIYHRYNVTLHDHTMRRCHDLRAVRWEASIREGYGFCGTMDAWMKVEGDPYAPMTIQSH